MKIIAKLKHDKLKFALFISVAITIIIDNFLIIFDIVQFFMSKSNSANLSSSFLYINLFVFLINTITLIFYIVFLVLKNKSVSNKKQKWG